MNLDENEFICPNGHRFRAKNEKRGRIYCPKCYRSFTRQHLEKIKAKRG